MPCHWVIGSIMNTQWPLLRKSPRRWDNWDFSKRPATGITSQKNGIPSYTTANPENSQYWEKINYWRWTWFYISLFCYFRRIIEIVRRKWCFNKQYFTIVIPKQEMPDEILRVLSSKCDISSTHKTDPFLFYVLRPSLSLSVLLQRTAVTWTTEKQFHIKPEWRVIWELSWVRVFRITWHNGRNLHILLISAEINQCL
jgi:hypothetical protein